MVKEFNIEDGEYFINFNSEKVKFGEPLSNPNIKLERWGSDNYRYEEYNGKEVIISNDEFSDNEYYNADIVICNTEKPKVALDFLKNYSIEKIVLDTDYDEELKDYWKSNGNKAKLYIKNKEITDFNLYSNVAPKMKSIYDNKAGEIWRGDKTLIVKEKVCRFGLNEKFYLTDKNKCYGVISLDSIRKITPSKFTKMYSEHKLNNKERLKKWKTCNKVLYGYEFHFIEKFDKPREVSQSGKFFSKTNFLNYRFKEDIIEKIKNYNPSEINDEKLISDWKVVKEWYDKREKVPISIEDIVNVARLIYLEIKKRNLDYDFEDSMLFKIISKGIFKNYVKKKGSRWCVTHSNGKIIKCFDTKKKALAMHKAIIASKAGKLSEQVHATSDGLKPLTEKLNNMEIIHDCISVVGSTVKSKSDHKPEDIDLVIRLNNPPKYLKRAIETRMKKAAPELADKFHFIWGEPEGSHDSFVPLYNLSLTKANRKVVRMSKDIKVGNMFEPMKSTAKKGTSLFFDVDELVNKVDIKDKLVVEKKYNGFHVIIHKSDDILVQTEGKKNITSSLPDELINAIDKLNEDNFILEGELIAYKDGKNMGRAPLVKYVQGKEKEKPIGDLKIICWDVLYYNNKSLQEHDLYERKKALNVINWNDTIKKVKPKVVDNKKELREAVEKFMDMEGSEGAMIKQWGSVYKPASETSNYIKFKVQQKIYVEIIGKKKSGDAYVYNIGVPLTKKEKVIDKKIKDGLLDLGNTFLTDTSAKKGDVLEIRVEQVWRHKQTNTGKIYYSLHKPRVIGKVNKEPSNIDYLDKLVVSRGSEVTFSGEHFYELKEDDEEGGTRSSAAVDFWEKNWHKMYPTKDGEFVYQEHFRGLTEEETKLDRDELCDTGNSLHGDLRGRHDSNDAWGWTIFLGKAEENKKEDKLIELSKSHKEEDKLRVHPKLRIPEGWLEVGKDNPKIVEPSGVGATKNKYAKFFALDWGKYEAGVWRKHFFELFLKGKKMDKRLIVSYVPVGGERVWMAYFPEDQTPYAKSHDKEETIKELKKKNQKYLIWNDPTDNKDAEKINI